MSENETSAGLNFIEAAIEEDLNSGKCAGPVHTRFPPEPNGYLHIGHAKAFCVNFGIAERFGGLCNLRFDDTNPTKEETRYVEAIQADLRWMGMDWGDRLCFASDYFEQLYAFAVRLIEKGKAYVCDLSAEEIRAYRGTLTEPGRESPYRDRAPEESLDLFARMRAGEFPEGARVLRAKIDMASPNLFMRDPVMYRIVHATHHRTGDTWCIYPTYDWTHGQCDAIEEITHSLCDVEFENHRPLYDWFIRELGIFPSRQIEFAKLNLSHTVIGKRHLRPMVEDGTVSGWDDPRLLTIAGMRRRGYTPEAIRAFIDRAGVTKKENLVDVSLLEFHVRDDLNRRVPRVMGVVDPLRVVIENYPVGEAETFDVPYFPDEPEKMGSREVPFSRVIYIERGDFMEDPPRKFFRLAPGREVRLRRAYYITCTEVVKDEATGKVAELRCTYDPETRGGSSPDGRKVRGTIHWVSAEHAVEAEVRMYDRLFTAVVPGSQTGEVRDDVNPDSLEVLKGCKLEPSLAEAKPGDRVQFERLGYFCVDPDSSDGGLVFNRTIPLRDSWAKIAQSA
jgi:glutaminyl-tRNA synthetase